MGVNWEEVCEKFEPEVIKGLDSENVIKIVLFLEEKKINFIEDMLTDYLDLFLIPIEEFVVKYNKLDKIHNHSLKEVLEEDFSILERFLTL